MAEPKTPKTNKNGTHVWVKYGNAHAQLFRDLHFGRYNARTPATEIHADPDLPTEEAKGELHEGPAKDEQNDEDDSPVVDGNLDVSTMSPQQTRTPNQLGKQIVVPIGNGIYFCIVYCDMNKQTELELSITPDGLGIHKKKSLHIIAVLL